MDTQLKMQGMYTLDREGGEIFVVSLYDGGEKVDDRVYYKVAGELQTPVGYANTPAGARAHAKDEWF